MSPTSSPTLDGCDFDIDAYLSQCYCTDTSPGMGSPFNRFEHENEYKYRDNNYGYHDNMNNYKHYGGYDNKKIPVYNHNPNPNPMPNSPISYPEPNPSPSGYMIYFSIMLNFVVLGYMFYIFGCTPIKGRGHKIRYSKVNNYDSEQNAINA